MGAGQILLLRLWHLFSRFCWQWPGNIEDNSEEASRGDVVSEKSARAWTFSKWSNVVVSYFNLQRHDRLSTSFVETSQNSMNSQTHVWVGPIGEHVTKLCDHIGADHNCIWQAMPYRKSCVSPERVVPNPLMSSHVFIKATCGYETRLVEVWGAANCLQKVNQAVFLIYLYFVLQLEVMIHMALMSFNNFCWKCIVQKQKTIICWKTW